MQTWSHIFGPLLLTITLTSIVSCGGSQSSQVPTSTVPTLPITTSPIFPLHVSGPAIVDTKGNRVHLAAVNWYGAESADYVVGGLQLQTLQTIVAQIKSLGFNADRKSVV